MCCDVESSGWHLSDSTAGIQFRSWIKEKLYLWLPELFAPLHDSASPEGTVYDCRSCKWDVLCQDRDVGVTRPRRQSDETETPEWRYQNETGASVPPVRDETETDTFKKCLKTETFKIETFKTKATTQMTAASELTFCHLQAVQILEKKLPDDLFCGIYIVNCCLTVKYAV